MHRPETWGFVQFSKVEAGGGVVAFKRDPDHAAGMYLMKVYYAQADFQAKNKRWATSIEELGLAADSGPNNLPTDTRKRLEDLGYAPKDNSRFAASAKIELAGSGYKASVDSARGGRWYVREDSRLWREPE